MKYFHGFSLQNEAKLFSDIISSDEYTVAGFSYGAQKAFEYAYASKTRVQRLILLSPAFFQTEDRRFLRTQLRYFTSQKEAYIKQFLNNVAHPSSYDLEEFVSAGTYDELEALLGYVWDKKRLQTLIDKGTDIEVFLGEEDKIINSENARTFFSTLCTTYSVKDVGHLLH